MCDTSIEQHKEVGQGEKPEGIEAADSNIFLWRTRNPAAQGRKIGDATSQCRMLIHLQFSLHTHS